MVDWTKRVFAGSLLGAAAGVLIGLLLARLLWPPAGGPATSPAALPTATPPAPLPATPAAAGDAALLWVSGLYAHDGDLGRARERLAGIGVADPALAVGDLALRYGAAGGSRVATDLATLAAALGDGRAQLVAYVATATDTATPPPSATPMPTPTPTATPSPAPTATPVPPPTDTPRPTAPPPPAATRAPRPTSTPPEPTALPLVWDHRVDVLSPPVRLVSADVAPGQLYWKLVRLEWWRGHEGGNCLIYISTLKQDGGPKWGQPVIVEHGPQERLYTDPKPGEAHGVNYVMNATLNSYIVYVDGDHPSDRVTGLGMGEWLGGMDHTTFVLVFQLARR